MLLELKEAVKHRGYDVPPSWDGAVLTVTISVNNPFYFFRSAFAFSTTFNGGTWAGFTFTRHNAPPASGV